jgi:dTDP-4-amino-4,6-dideoxygalactose transaminase
VLVPANSFIATSEAVTSVGAHVVFVDVDAVTYNIDVNRIEEKITSRTKAVIPVHLYGQPADMAEINALADRTNLKVIEDAAQAHGARYQGKRVGCLGNVACFSFYPGKNLGAYGDAGAIVTGDADLAGKCRMLANHGRLEKYSHKMEGHNSRLDGLQAAILSVKLKQLDRWSVERNRVADVYRRELGLDRLTLPEIRPDRDHVFHIFGVLAEKRDGLRDYLKEKGIATGIHYPTPLPLLEAYRYLGHQSGTFPVSERLSESMVSLPIYPELTEAQQAHVTGAVKEFYRV